MTGKDEYRDQEVSNMDPQIANIDLSQQSSESVSKHGSSNQLSNDNGASDRLPARKKTSGESMVASVVDSEANQVRPSRSTRKANLKVRLEDIQNYTDLSNVAEENEKS